MGKLLLVPEGGLGNRMRTVASAYEHCRRIGSKLQVVWFTGWGMKATFGSLLEPADDGIMTVRDATPTDSLLYQTPRLHNLYVPWLAQRLMFKDKRIYAKQMYALKRGGLAEMYALAACQRIYGSAGSSFSPMAASLSNGNAAYECLATTKK